MNINRFAYNGFSQYNFSILEQIGEDTYDELTSMSDCRSWITDTFTYILGAKYNPQWEKGNGPSLPGIYPIKQENPLALRLLKANINHLCFLVGLPKDTEIEKNLEKYLWPIEEFNGFKKTELITITINDSVPFAVIKPDPKWLQNTILISLYTLTIKTFLNRELKGKYFWTDSSIGVKERLYYLSSDWDNYANTYKFTANEKDKKALHRYLPKIWNNLKELSSVETDFRGLSMEHPYKWKTPAQQHGAFCIYNSFCAPFYKEEQETFFVKRVHELLEEGTSNEMPMLQHVTD